MEKIKKSRKPRIGIYSMGLKAYWNQFPGLKERLTGYGSFIANKVSLMDADVFFYGIVDCPDEGRACGEYFNANNVDLILAHSATYVTSASILPVHQICKAPAVVLNLQPTASLAYADTGIGEWLANCGACPVPEISNAFERAGIEYRDVNGILGLSDKDVRQNAWTPAADEVTSSRQESLKAWNEIREWIDAARVKAALHNCRFGFLGNNYNGMLDLYSDFTMLTAQTGIEIELLEMCDLDRIMKSLSEEEIAEKQHELSEFFVISKEKSIDPMAKDPTPEELRWSAQVAAAQEKMVREFSLDGLAYYYHGAPGNPYEHLQSGFIAGHSLLTAKGIPCAGEGDLKTCLAMKIADILGKGGSFCEIVVTDYNDGTILMGHDGPFHLAIADGKPILRGLGIYHGKQGSGVSVEARVRPGDITNLSCTQTRDGKLKFIITEAEATAGEIMRIGNTQTHVRFKEDPDTYMHKWFAESPTHHFAMSVGHNAGVFSKVSDLLEIPSICL